MLKILELCDCLPYYFETIERIPVCNFQQIKCLVDHYGRWTLNAILPLLMLKKITFLYFMFCFGSKTTFTRAVWINPVAVPACPVAMTSTSMRLQIKWPFIFTIILLTRCSECSISIQQNLPPINFVEFFLIEVTAWMRPTCWFKLRSENKSIDVLRKLLWPIC